MIYIPWWFQCNLTADCSINDLCLLKDINEFTGFDEAIAQKAIINNIHVVSDRAERGVKLVSHFLCRVQLE